MAGLFGGSPKISAPAPAPPPPTIDDTAERVARAERERAMRVQSRQADIKTSGAGVTDEYESVKKRLLGD